MQLQAQVKRLVYIKDDHPHRVGIPSEPRYWVNKRDPFTNFGRSADPVGQVYVIDVDGVDYYYKLHDDGEWWKLEWPD